MKQFKRHLEYIMRLTKIKIPNDSVLQSKIISKGSAQVSQILPFLVDEK